MNILHIIPDLCRSTGGPVTAVRGLTRAQAALGHHVTLIATDHGHVEASDFTNVDVRLFSCIFPRWRWSKTLGEALPALVKKSAIVHLHTMWEYPTWIGARVCQTLGKPYIVRPCGMLDKWSLSQKAWKKKLYLSLTGNTILRNAAAIHFTSKLERENAYNFSMSPRSFISPLGVDSRSYEKLPPASNFKERNADLKGKQIVLYVGRLHYKKQPEALIRAFCQAFCDDEKIMLVMIGSSSPAYLKKLKGLTHSLKLGQRVVMMGSLSEVAIREAYCAADMFVLPSLQENFGLSVIEAMAAGCPVIISDRLDLAREIENEKAGVVCKPDVQAIASAMIKIKKDKVFSKQIGDNARRMILEKFTWENAAEELTNTYKKIMQNKVEMSSKIH